MTITKGFTCGAFDLLHTGHALMLKECKEYCDYLIVGLQRDPTIDRPEKNKPVQSYEERDIMLKSIRWVDEVVYYDTEDDLELLLQSLERLLKLNHKTMVINLAKRRRRITSSLLMVTSVD